MAAPTAPNTAILPTSPKKRPKKLPVQRTVRGSFEEQERLVPPKKWRIFYRSNTVPTSWTTVVTGAKSAPSMEESPKTIVSWASFVATDATAYTLQVRLQDPAGNNTELAQGATAADGDQFRPFNASNYIAVPPDWKIQIIGSGAGTVNCDVLIQGYEDRVE